jgi:hypothetical protein
MVRADVEALVGVLGEEVEHTQVTRYYIVYSMQQACSVCMCFFSGEPA